MFWVHVSYVNNESVFKKLSVSFSNVFPIVCIFLIMSSYNVYSQICNFDTNFNNCSFFVAFQMFLKIMKILNFYNSFSGSTSFIYGHLKKNKSNLLMCPLTNRFYISPWNRCKKFTIQFVQQMLYSRQYLLKNFHFSRSGILLQMTFQKLFQHCQ